MLCSASRVEGGEFICIYMRSEVSSKNLVACICMIDLHAGMDQKVRWIYSYDATVGSYL